MLALVGLLSLIVGVTVVGLVAWAWDRPVLAIILALGFLFAWSLEGAYRVFDTADRRAQSAESDLAFLREPHLTLEVEGIQFMSFKDQPGEGGNYAIVKVSADREVSNCGGHITRIVTEGNEIPVHAPIPLRWIAHDRLERDLVPGISYGMAVVFTESTRPSETLISTDSHAPRGIPYALNAGDTRLTVVISADGVPPLQQGLRVRSYGDWRTISMSEDDGAPFERHPVIGTPAVPGGSTLPYDRADDAGPSQQTLAPGTVPYNPATVPYPDVAGVTGVTASSIGLVPGYQLRAEPLRVTRAIYGVHGREVDVTGTLNALIEDGIVLDFFADNATLVKGNDPAPGEPKKLRIRWTEYGVGKASSFLEGTHVVIPDPS
jgi:hypothetical protein